MPPNTDSRGSAPARRGSGAARAASKTRAPYRKSERSRRRILNAAAHLFRRKGYADTSLRDIAHRANMISGSIYYHFDSKEDILDAVLQEGIIALHNAVRAAVEALPARATPRDRVSAAVHAHLNALLSQGDYIRANAREFERAPPVIRKRNLVLRQQYAAYWRSLFEEAKAAGQLKPEVDLTLLRLFLLGALHWTVDWYDASKQPISALADRLLSFFYYGVAEDPK
ncbi:MAG: TetR/AcrR family transcriptional regulator [Pseudorhodoplanes sp.]|uniref:TetR/AcrR family transcriptional regulator n=1 Tax=Pseudorhodoplanes sp. TaxID=1934341 RepID=UPI003D103B5D